MAYLLARGLSTPGLDALPGPGGGLGTGALGVPPRQPPLACGPRRPALLPGTSPARPRPARARASRQVVRRGAGRRTVRGPPAARRGRRLGVMPALLALRLLLPPLPAPVPPHPRRRPAP